MLTSNYTPLQRLQRDCGHVGTRRTRDRKKAVEGRWTMSRPGVPCPGAPGGPWSHHTFATANSSLGSPLPTADGWQDRRRLFRREPSSSSSQKPPSLSLRRTTTPAQETYPMVIRGGDARKQALGPLASRSCHRAAVVGPGHEGAAHLLFGPAAPCSRSACVTTSLSFPFPLSLSAASLASCGVSAYACVCEANMPSRPSRPALLVSCSWVERALRRTAR